MLIIKDLNHITYLQDQLDFINVVETNGRDKSEHHLHLVRYIRINDFTLFT